MSTTSAATHPPKCPTCTAVLAFQVLLLLFSGPLVAAEATLQKTLADLAWIAGDWVGDEDDSFIQEQWSAPQSNDMMGMFRLIQDGEVVFYEFMTITRESSGVVLRIKHFDPGLVGWEGKSESVLFHLDESAEQRAVFATEKDGHPERLVYERRQNELVITLEKPAKDSRTQFRYQLQNP